MKKYKHAEGYNRLLINGKLVLEHRHIIETNLGRKLKADEIVHHINGIKSDNDISNLEIQNRANHSRHHALETPQVMIDLFCYYCEKAFKRRRSRIQSDQRRGQKEFFCSRLCSINNLHKPVSTIG